MQIEFFTVDVFTNRQFGGNPLAVIPKAEGLSAEQMQAIASEFNLSETTFVLPPEDPAHTAQVRIFTPRAEMPFAGHPNVGTAYVLAREAEKAGARGDGSVLEFEEIAGLVRIELLKEGAQTVGARLASPQKFAQGKTVAAEIVADACSLPVDAVETANHAPVVASCGAPFLFAELKSRDALAAAVPRTEVFSAHLPRDEITGIHLYVLSDDGVADIHSRMFGPLHGVFEDPATGSANVALIGLLAALHPEPDLRLSKTIAQGDDMGRPSVLAAVAEKANGTVNATYIGGKCVPVMQGALTLA
jgi:trans-2,3-dihydro-3-hydroxyanthranilate isomerase